MSGAVLAPFPHHLAGAAGIPTNDTVGVPAVANVEVKPSRDLLAKRQRSRLKVSGLVALHREDGRDVDRSRVDVGGVRSRVGGSTV